MSRCFRMLWLALLAASLVGCATATVAPQSARYLKGVVAVGGPLPNATVTVADLVGVKRAARADQFGAYSLDVTGMIAPFVVSAIEAGGNTNCRYNNSLRARCMAALVIAVSAGSNIANVNPLTDRIASDVAVRLKYVGPQQLVDVGDSVGLNQQNIGAATEALQAAFKNSFKDAGISEQFDPVTTPMKPDHTGLDAILDVINHNRGYDNSSGESSQTILSDISFRPIVGLQGAGYEPLDFKRARKELAEIKAAKTRILIVGDSIAATYELERLPRMGWGQVFAAQFKPDASVKVLNGARAGRSSRDFYNGGWYQQMARFMKAGDYVLINHGHNDSTCDGSRGPRGVADVANLCTYPNDANGLPQFPQEKPEMSFQKSLERYISLARARGAIPVLLTPATRVRNAEREIGFPVVPNHFTRPAGMPGIAFDGNYSQTIKDAARANQVPLIDLEARTISFANAHEANWKDYWLAVRDKVKYPYYATQTIGTFAFPDSTHFQQRGAEAVAEMVAQGVRETPELKALAAELK